MICTWQFHRELCRKEGWTRKKKSSHSSSEKIRIQGYLTTQPSMQDHGKGGLLDKRGWMKKNASKQRCSCRGFAPKASLHAVESSSTAGCPVSSTPCCGIGCVSVLWCLSLPTLFRTGKKADRWWIGMYEWYVDRGLMQQWCHWDVRTTAFDGAFRYQIRVLMFF